MFPDRSIGLWRTLQIWTNDFRNAGAFCSQYLLVTNATASGTIAGALRAPVSTPDRATAIVAATKAAAQAGRGARKPKKLSAIQPIIDDVMASPIQDLIDLASRINVV